MTANWLDTLAALVQREWDDKGQAILLSRVPSLFEDEGFDPEDILQGRKLRPFLENETEGRFRVLRSDDQKIVWGLLPATAQISEPYTRYFPKSSSDRPIRFAPSAWKAFTLAIPEGQRRWLFDQPSIRFEDFASDEAAVDGHEVERRFVTVSERSEDDEVHRATVLSSIAAWAAEKSIDPSRFALGRKRAPVSKAAQPSPAPGSTGATALDQLLSLLQPGELTRISLPLDVVARLRSATQAPSA